MVNAFLCWNVFHRVNNSLEELAVISTERFFLLWLLDVLVWRLFEKLLATTLAVGNNFGWLWLWSEFFLTLTGWASYLHAFTFARATLTTPSASFKIDDHMMINLFLAKLTTIAASFLSALTFHIVLTIAIAHSYFAGIRYDRCN